MSEAELADLDRKMQKQANAAAERDFAKRKARRMMFRRVAQTVMKMLGNKAMSAAFRQSMIDKGGYRGVRLHLEEAILDLATVYRHDYFPIHDALKEPVPGDLGEKAKLMPKAKVVVDMHRLARLTGFTPPGMHIGGGEGGDGDGGSVASAASIASAVSLTSAATGLLSAPIIKANDLLRDGGTLMDRISDDSGPERLAMLLAGRLRLHTFDPELASDDFSEPPPPPAPLSRRHPDLHRDLRRLPRQCGGGQLPGNQIRHD